MNTSDTDQTLFMSRPEGLARILALDDDGTDLWSPEEIRSMWQHQLSAPIDIDLATVVSVRATILRNSPCIDSYKGKSFAELFSDPQPPVELLELVKEFAKQTLKDSEEAQLKEVASGLYYASYAAGLARCGKFIGSMKAEELRPGFNWALRQDWLDEETRKLIASGLESLAATKQS